MILVAFLLSFHDHIPYCGPLPVIHHPQVDHSHSRAHFPLYV